MMSTRLDRLTVHGFKTIRELSDFAPRELTVLIGPNGAGKSNFVAFFRFLGWMMSGDLQTHVARLGGANAVLHDGSARTPQLHAQIALQSDRGTNEYRFRLFHGAGDTLIFADEAYRFSDRSFPNPAPWKELGAGHREARLNEAANGGDVTGKFLRDAIRRCVVHQFHNTSDTARMKQRWDQADAGYLKEDGANLAPMLLRLKTEEPKLYVRLLESLRLVLPFFGEFELAPEFGRVLLRWSEKGSDQTFGVDQASDGMLRIMQLWTLLLMPAAWRPSVLILDEPELGLHPSAIVHLCGMLRSTSKSTQVIAATQSSRLVDEFEADDIVVVERPNRESKFTQKNAAELDEWLSEYSLAQLWEKNVLGGKP